MPSENFKSNLITGLAAGVGATLLAPVLLRLIRPATKAAIKGSVLLYEKGRESFAELSETVDDLVAEVKSEMETGPAGDAAMAASAAQTAGAQGKTGTPPAQHRSAPDTGQNLPTTAAVQPDDAARMSQSPPASPAAKANEGQRDEGAQGRPPAKGG
ncbi:MAG: hypothetical protein ABS69_15160 [Nitrosomonadales bacterium SCN 54-20]|nr:MAG: hypothetical protein ABS69_15160 [Nitrosomonadales bacterium SCN 54-20]